MNENTNCINRVGELEGGTISNFRLGNFGEIAGIVVEKNGVKKILRIAYKTKKSLFGRHIIDAYFDVEDYW